MKMPELTFIDDCIDECRACAEICTETLYQCLKLGGEHADSHHVAMLANRARMCDTNAHFMLSRSRLHAVTCYACSIVCSACADDCEAMSDDLRDYVVACRSCAAVCRDMAMMGDEFLTETDRRANPRAETRSPMHRN